MFLLVHQSLDGVIRRWACVGEAVSSVWLNRWRVVCLDGQHDGYVPELGVRPRHDTVKRSVADPMTASKRRDLQRDHFDCALAIWRSGADHPRRLVLQGQQDIERDRGELSTPPLLGVPVSSPLRQRGTERARSIRECSETEASPDLPIVRRKHHLLDHAPSLPTRRGRYTRLPDLGERTGQTPPRTTGCLSRSTPVSGTPRPPPARDPHTQIAAGLDQ